MRVATLLQARNHRLSKHLRDVQLELATMQRPMLDPPGVEDWKRQYDVLQERYNMLMLCGPSKTGKTMWARQAFGARTRCFEVSCAKCNEPDLREYDFWKIAFPGLHRFLARFWYQLASILAPEIKQKQKKDPA